MADSSVLEPLPKSLIAASQPCMIVQTLRRQNTEKNKGGQFLRVREGAKVAARVGKMSCRLCETRLYSSGLGRCSIPRLSEFTQPCGIYLQTLCNLVFPARGAASFTEPRGLFTNPDHGRPQNLGHLHVAEGRERKEGKGAVFRAI